MKKYVILVSMLVLIAAVAITIGVAGRGNAYPTGWDGGCGNCHAGGPGSSNILSAHNVAAHTSIIAADCLNCHNTSPGDTPVIAKCANCHGGLTHIVNEPTHSTSGCLAVGCHANPTTTTEAATTTTEAATTTTTAGGTTTTAAGTTSTTAGGTTTTAAGTTSTTHAASTTTTHATTTSTTVPTTEPAFTG